MTKKILTSIVTLCFLVACLTASVIPAAAASSLVFCNISLTTEAGGDYYYEDSFSLNPQDDTWIPGTESYQGVTDYLMSTNCDKDQDPTIFDSTTYAVSFEMPYTGMIHFKASVSGEDYCDYLSVLADMEEIYSTADVFYDEWNLTPWIDVSVMARKGQKISLCYRKDGSVTEGEDRAYIADLSLEDLDITFSDEVADTSWYSEEETEFEISTREELAGFSLLVNDGITFEDCTVSLMNDIDLSGLIWIPAGQYNYDLYRNNMPGIYSLQGVTDSSIIPGLNAYFSGIFDGKGNAISNLTCKYAYPYTTYIGFIAMNFGIIQNLDLKNPVVGDGDTAKAAGAIAGYNGGLITRCAVMGGKIDIVWERYLLAYAGGLVGTNGYVFSYPFITDLNNEGGVITQCSSSADVNVTYTRTGFMGSPNDGTELFLAAAGGLMGATYGGLVQDCYSTGDVTATALIPEEYDGGITLQTETDPNDTFALAGGFIGMVLSALPESLFQNGDGGPDPFDTQEPAEPVIASLENCYATGVVTANGPSAATSVASGFLGFARNMTPSQPTPTYLVTAANCYFDNITTGKTNGFKKAANFEGITGKSTSDMKSESTFTDWDFEEIWHRYDSVNDGYPVLKGMGDGNVFTVTFTGFNNAVLKTQIVLKGSSATAPAAPAVDGYTFIQWDSAFNAVTANITVKAQYNVNCVVENDNSAEGVDGTSFNPSTILEVRLITSTLSAADKSKYQIAVAALSSGKKLIDLYSVRLLLDNEAVQPGGPIRIRIKLSGAQQVYDDLQIAYVDSSDNMTILPGTVENGYIVFQVDHLSEFALIGTPQESPPTGDNNKIPLVLFLLVSLLFLIPVTIAGKRRFETK